MEVEHWLCVAIGALLMTVLLVAISPDYKKDCDSFGKMRFGSVVYECKPADQR